MNKEVLEVLSGFHQVKITDKPVFTPYYEVYCAKRAARHYMSLFLLSAHSHYWGVFRDCLVVVKKKNILGTYCIQLIIPPMHKDGDFKVEREVMEFFNTEGVQSKLSGDDVIAGGYGEDIMRHEPSKKVQIFSEVIYAAKDHAEMVGGAFKNARVEWNKSKRLAAEGRFEVEVNPWQCVDDVNEIAMAWEALKLSKNEKKCAVSKTEAGLLEYTTTLYPDDFTVMVYRVDGDLVGFSYVERVSCAHAVIVKRLRSYSSTVFQDPTLLMHVFDSKHWYNKGVSTFNIGASRCDGLYAAKLKLKPIKMLSIRFAECPMKLTAEDYSSVKFST